MLQRTLRARQRIVTVAVLVIVALTVTREVTAGSVKVDVTAGRVKVDVAAGSVKVVDLVTAGSVNVDVAVTAGRVCVTVPAGRVKVETDPDRVCVTVVPGPVTVAVEPGSCNPDTVTVDASHVRTPPGVEGLGLMLTTAGLVLTAAVDVGTTAATHARSLNEYGLDGSGMRLSTTGAVYNRQ